MHGDVVAAARVLFCTTPSERKAVLRRLLRQAQTADQYRLACGRAHPLWGDGSLMVAALKHSPPKEPQLDDLDYCDCMAQVFEALVTLGRNSHKLRRLGQDQAA